MGKTDNHYSFLAMIAVFRVLCTRSTNPFVCGWYAVVLNLWKPIMFDSSVNNSDSNWLPLSVMA